MSIIDENDPKFSPIYQVMKHEKQKSREIVSDVLMRELTSNRARADQLADSIVSALEQHRRDSFEERRRLLLGPAERSDAAQ